MVNNVGKFAIILLLMCTCSCSSNRSNIDSGILSQSPCTIPCWQGITPGVSVTSDVEVFIKNLDQQDWPSRKDFHRGTGCEIINITNAHSNESAVLRLSIKDDKLIFIESFQVGKFQLKEIIDVLGEPEFYKALVTNHHGEDFFVLEVYYPSKGVSFILSTDSLRNNQITPSIKVNTVQYYAPGDLSSFLISGVRCDLSSEDAITFASIEILDIQPWTGFETIMFIPIR